MNWNRIKLAAIRHIENAKTMAELQFWQGVYFQAMSLPFTLETLPLMKDGKIIKGIGRLGTMELP